MVFGNSDALMGGHNAKAQNAGARMECFVNHGDIGLRQSVHLGLTVCGAISRGENDFLMGSGIILYGTSTGATANKNKKKNDE
jgi:hypothetical protein